jgi:hypothetical protein
MWESRTEGDFLVHDELLSLFTAHLYAGENKALADVTTPMIQHSHKHIHYSEARFDEMKEQERNDFCVDCRCHCSQTVPLGRNVQCLGY